MGNISDNTAQQATTGSLDQLVAANNNNYVGIYPNHNHQDPCEHAEFKYCKRCDVVQCGKCWKEWEAKKFTTTYAGLTPRIY